MSKPLPCDELPLWSAPFGLCLLETIRLKRFINILDIGSGTGFPMLEIAERSGLSCMVYGIDPDPDAIALINRKKELHGIVNARILKACAEELPFPDGYFGLIVANNGLNNVQDPERVLAECFRVCDKGAQMVLTMNLPHTMTEFYEVYEEILLQEGMHGEVGAMKQHIDRLRKPAELWSRLIEEAGFSIRSVQPDGFRIHYTEGTAMLNHSFIRNHFLKPWLEFIPQEKQHSIMQAVERRINDEAGDRGGFSLSVPFACFDCVKP